ncbi:MAG TPA: glycosyltransferase, partial [Coxiellaceae bacterium]|nr:glycosyltransferase [Coxiellaceae bacterium]
ITGRGHLYSSQKKLYQLLRLFFNFLLRFSFSHPNSKVLIQNNEDKEYFIKQRLLMPSQTVLIKGSGVDMEKFRPYPIPPSPPFVVLLACRLLWSKGVGEYVEAARLLKNKFNAQFLLAGKIDYENPEAISPQQIHQWDQEGCIEYLGFYANMLPLFQCAHVVCLPTCYGEGIPKVLIEAAAVGRPIVTTQTPGCNAIVQEGVNGHLVPPKDFRALAEALQSFFIQPEKIDSMGKASRQRVEKEYDINVVNQTILEAYEELVR